MIAVMTTQEETQRPSEESSKIVFLVQTTYDFLRVYPLCLNLCYTLDRPFKEEVIYSDTSMSEGSIAKGSSSLSFLSMSETL